MGWTHPGLCTDGMGKYLGRARGFTIDEENPSIVRANLTISKSASKSPSGDLGEYVMTLAEEDPEAFGASIVFGRDLESEQTFMSLNRADTGDIDDEGAAIMTFRSPDSRNVKNLRHARLAELRAVDVVDEPAANPAGFFSITEEHAWRGEVALGYILGLSEEDPGEMALGLDPERIKTFVHSYLDRHGLTIADAKEIDAMTEQTKAATLPELRTRFSTHSEFILEQLEAGVTMEQADVAFGQRQLETATESLKAAEASLADLQGELDAMKTELGTAQTRITQLEGRGHPGVVIDSGSRQDPNAEIDLSMLPDDERFEGEWKADPMTRTAFSGKFDDYMAYRRAAERGAVKI